MFIQLINNLHYTTNLSSVIPILAFIISIVALISNRTFSRKNIQLSIKQAIFKTVSEKVKDCNLMWELEPDNEKANEFSPHFKIISELVISKEIIEKSFDLFSKNDNSIIGLKDEYYFLFWKQLRTDLRGWFRKTTDIANSIDNKYYTQQIKDLVQIFQKHSEQVL